MKTAALLALGTFFGAVGAWLFMDEALMSPAMPDADRDSSVPGNNIASDRTFGDRGSGAHAVLDSNGDANLIASLKLRADSAPLNAFNEALALSEGGLRMRALIQVARVWARRAPRDALEQALGLPEKLRALAESTVAEEWAIVDPAGFLDYAEAADSIDQIITGLDVLLATDPERVWAIANRHADPANPAVDELYLDAVRAMAGRDPIGTIARFQSVATGQRRGLILSSIAEGYADRDAEAALAWVLSVQPLSPDAASTVIRKIAVEDPLRAYQVIWQSGKAGLSIDGLRWMLGAAALESRQDPAAIANALVQRYEPEFSDPLVSALLNSWVQQAPDSAMSWLSANRANLNPESVTTMVSTLAFEDVRLAASLLERVPPEFEFQWLQETAKRYGQFDSNAAVNWLSQFETRPDYDQLLSQMVLYGESRFAAALVESSDHAIDSSAISLAANMFAGQDPRAAAEWALRLTDENRSAAAIEGVTTGWLRTDPAAAQRWALETPRGELRDKIIDTLFEQGTRFPLDIEALIEGYSSNAAADRSIARHVERVVSNRSFYGDAGILRAEQLIELITDFNLRREAAKRIAEEIRSMSGASAAR